VIEGCDGDACDKLFGTLTQEQLNDVEAIAMDRLRAYIKAAAEHLPNADVLHDRF